MEQKKAPPFWAGFKFFNVFGPNEYHKGRMASVVFHAYNQIKETGKVSLFRSHNENFADGAQERDFIYVKDVVSVMMHFLVHRKNSGLYNLGTGTCRTFEDLAKSVFGALDLLPEIDFVDMPMDIRDKYQYHTEANMERLVAAGYRIPFTPLEVAVDDYVKNYLNSMQYL
jgi:ADP-L-glycero-D-manno-heptose 6-epimerase